MKDLIRIADKATCCNRVKLSTSHTLDCQYSRRSFKLTTLHRTSPENETRYTIIYVISDLTTTTWNLLICTKCVLLDMFRLIMASLMNKVRRLTQSINTHDMYGLCSYIHKEVQSVMTIVDWRMKEQEGKKAVSCPSCFELGLSVTDCKLTRAPRVTWQTVT